MSSLLKVSEAAVIALHACAWLAGQPGQRGRSAEVCRAMGFSPAHFVKVMQSLARAGLIASQRGPAGGSALTRPARSIRLLEIFEAVEGPLQPERCLLPPGVCQASCCLLGSQLRAHHRALRKTLATTTLARLAASRKNNGAKTHA
ncbi:MAG: Rrf2 family transcriptional regulator [Kiritimatiellae bacterium]|nr:Rrf2 family transcriptional regulator [Kiritimatiellia bacterium]